jgi:two-component system, chemotaxis family, chemotaxis protein CheY
MPNDKEISAARLASTKVLVVNDDHNSRKFIRNLLTIIGFQKIYQAANGPAGLDLIKAKAPDVVIIDWEMGLDGDRFVQAVRSPGRCAKPGLPIIMLISLASSGRMMGAAQFAVSKFLLKPVSLQSLRESVAAVMH